MRNKLLASLMTSILFLVVPAISQAATVKVGAKCTKLNATSGAFICKSVGGKLIWQKKPIVKLAPTPAESPKATPTPTPAPEPTGPSAPITFDNLDLKWTSIVARNELNAQIAKLITPKSTVEIISGPNVVASQLDEEKRLLAIAETLFSKYYQPASYQIVFFSEKDGVWADQALATYGGSYSSLVSEIAKSPKTCNFAFATIGKKGPIYYQCMDTRGRGDNDKQTAIHEYFHLVQQKYKSSSMACWLLEGSATYFGIALGVDGADKSGATGRKFIEQLAYQYDPGGSSNNPPNSRMHALAETTEGVVKLMTDLELQPRSQQDNCLTLGAYSGGHIATEVLIAVKGFTTYMSFLESLKNGKEWQENFATIFGISTQEFYKKLAPYFKTRI